MLANKKVVILQPSHNHGVKAAQDKPWDNDSFSNLSRLFNAPLYNITDQDIPLDADIYLICNCFISLLEQEIEFAKKVKSLGKKVIVCFSHDYRFTLGADLMTPNGILYTDLCEVADVIAGGVNTHLNLYGRFQHKVFEMEILENLNFSLPYEQRDIDFLTCAQASDTSLSLEVELLLLFKEKYPDKKVCCLAHGNSVEITKKLQARFPQIYFPINEGQSLLYYMKRAKCFCNVENRPRPGRMLIEAYYCRTPFIGPSCAYFSRLCFEFSYLWFDYDYILEKYEKISKETYNDLVLNMEQTAQFYSIENVEKRIIEKLGV
jgi:hypothetical protein